jgi:WhiB family redox-sensing transcriptional regulator
MTAVWETEVRDSVVSVGDYRSTAEELLDLLRGPAWRADALCKEYPKLAWFGNTDRSAKAAKAVCSSCLVREECLAYAMTDPTLDGIWGGLTRRERGLLRHSGSESLDRLPATA